MKKIPLLAAVPTPAVDPAFANFSILKLRLLHRHSTVCDHVRFFFSFFCSFHFFRLRCQICLDINTHKHTHTPALSSSHHISADTVNSAGMPNEEVPAPRGRIRTRDHARQRLNPEDAAPAPALNGM
jgi:hypothetical protein